jgi:hypothetical protein
MPRRRKRGGPVDTTDMCLKFPRFLHTAGVAVEAGVKPYTFSNATSRHTQAVQNYRIEYADGTVTGFLAVDDDDARQRILRWARQSPYTLVCVSDEDSVGRPVPLSED